MEDMDQALMVRIKKGDDRAFELLLSRHQNTVYNLAARFLNNRTEAEDITQEVFIRIYHAAGTYTPDAKFTTWLYTIVKNLCFNVLRRKKTLEIVSMEDEFIPEIPGNSEDPIEMIAREQLRERVSKVLSGLPENMRLAVILNKYHGLQYEEISRILGCSVNAVKLRMHRAKAVLSKELADLRETK